MCKYSKQSHALYAQIYFVTKVDSASKMMCRLENIFINSILKLIYICSDLAGGNKTHNISARSVCLTNPKHEKKVF